MKNLYLVFNYVKNRFYTIALFCLLLVVIKPNQPLNHMNAYDFPRAITID